MARRRRAPSVPSRADNSGQVRLPETVAIHLFQHEAAGQNPFNGLSTADSHAQSASSILVTRSTTEAQVIDPGLVCCPDSSTCSSLTGTERGHL
ncbi:FIG01133987: hypothetical protein [Streptomyces globisporus]|uniref:Uncharacterized protein n=1 Tax=Streptomyces globisporus TaxID=1908 RepID=A0ABN8V410_STRGL|nr:FIG01133987: hypothetical protein [Streptomyces globisporus]